MSPTNINVQSTITGATPTIWLEQAMQDRNESTPFEWLKDYTTAIFRDDDSSFTNKYPQPNQGYTRSYQVKRRLLGDGVTGTTELRGKEQDRLGNTYTFANQFVRTAVANNITVPATDILVADMFRGERQDLNEWAGRKKMQLDIGRMLLATSKIYGNGEASSLANVTSAMLLSDKSFVGASSIMKKQNAKPVQMLPDVDGKVDYRFYVMLADETTLDNLGLDSSWQTFIEAFNVSAGFKNPLAQVSYGMRNNVMLIPVESEEGFGSALRPSVIVGADHASIADSATVTDIVVGLPKYATTDYTDFTPDGITSYTKYLSAYLTATGTTASGIVCKVKKTDGSIIGPVTIKLGGSNTGYTIGLTNNSGDAYVPTAGDVITSVSSCLMTLGAEAYISSYPSMLWYSSQKEDYEFQSGTAVNFWEGGALTRNVRNITNGVNLNFVYSDVLF